MPRPVPPVTYLLDSSKSSLKNLLLVNLQDAAQFRKEFQKTFEYWVRSVAMSLFLDWLIRHGEDLVELASLSPRERAQRLENLRLDFPVQKIPHALPGPGTDLDAHLDVANRVKRKT